MTKTFSEYAASRTAVAGALGADDTMLVIQGGVVKKAVPGSTAVLVVAGGDGLRCQVTATYGGLADDEVTPIINLDLVPL